MALPVSQGAALSLTRPPGKKPRGIFPAKPCKNCQQGGSVLQPSQPIPASPATPQPGQWPWGCQPMLSLAEWLRRDLSTTCHIQRRCPEQMQQPKHLYPFPISGCGSAPVGPGFASSRDLNALEGLRSIMESLQGKPGHTGQVCLGAERCSAEAFPALCSSIFKKVPGPCRVCGAGRRGDAPLAPKTQ